MRNYQSTTHKNITQKKVTPGFINQGNIVIRSMSSSTASSSSPSKKQRLSLPVPVHANNDATQGPIVAANHEEDRKARVVLKQIGFNPEEDIDKACRIFTVDGTFSWSVTPLIYFCCTGNLTMCKYILSRGADSRKADDKNGCCPMYWAAWHDRLEICKLLFHDGGAHDDIRKVSRSGLSPLRVALHRGNYDVILWMIPNGAFSPRQEGVIDDMTMRNGLRQINNFIPKWDNDKRLTVLARAQDVVITHDNFKLFLKGTIISSASFRRHPKNEYATRSKTIPSTTTKSTTSSPLLMFKGTSGILEVIANYVGIPSAHDVRMFRQLMVLLTAFIKDEPFEKIEDDDDY